MIEKRLRMINEARMRQLIADRAAEVSQKTLAERAGVSPQYLCDVLKGRRDVSAQMAERFGYRRVVTFEPIAILALAHPTPGAPMMTDDRARVEGEAKPWVERNYPGHRNSGGRIVAPFDNDDQMGSILDALARRARAEEPIDMMLYCPRCHLQHVDEPDERTSDWTNPPHRSHLCHGCGCIWRPADVATNGVRAIETAGKADNWDVARTPEPSARGEAPFIYLLEHDTQPREFDEDPLTENDIQAGWRQTPLYKCPPPPAVLAEREQKLVEALKFYRDNWWNEAALSADRGDRARTAISEES